MALVRFRNNNIVEKSNGILWINLKNNKKIKNTWRTSLNLKCQRKFHQNLKKTKKTCKNTWWLLKKENIAGIFTKFVGFTQKS